MIAKKRYQAYPEMEESCIEYVGKKPAHWPLKRMKFLCKINPVKSEISDIPKDTHVSFLPMEKVGENGTIQLDETRALGDVFQGYTYFIDNDIILAKITPCFENGKGAICKDLCNGIGFGSTEFHVFRSNGNVIPSFINHIVSSPAFRTIGAAFMQGAAGQKRVTESFIRDFKIALPSLPEQQSIATFLDRKTALLDDLIAKKELMIKLLKEKRQATITTAVTKGLDPYVEMDDSGIEWIGKKPKHWKVKRFKHFLEFVTSGSRGWASYYSDDGDIFIRIGNLTRDSIDLDLSDIQYVTPPPGAEGERTKVIPGDILLSITAYLGSVAVVPKNIDKAFVSQHVALARPTKHSTPDWLGFSILSNLVKTQLEMSAYGGTKIQLGLDDVKSLVIFEPPIAEQLSIVNYLKTQDKKIASAISKITEQVVNLKEYRQSLIFNAVTGKIMVV